MRDVAILPAEEIDMAHLTLTLADWKTRYQPACSKHSANAFSLICPGSPAMNRVYDALRKRPACVWSLMYSVRDEQPYIQPGFEIVDCMGYLITRNPYTASDRHMKVVVDLEQDYLQLPSHPHSSAS